MCKLGLGSSSCLLPSSVKLGKDEDSEAAIMEDRLIDFDIKQLIGVLGLLLPGTEV